MGVNDGAVRSSKDDVSPFLDCTSHNVRREWSKWRDSGANGQVLEWIRHGVAAPWACGGPPPPFNHSVSCRGLPSDQASLLKEEIERLKVSGVLRTVEYLRWVSRASLVPKPTGTGWRLVVDLRKINAHCQTRKMKMETMHFLRLIPKQGDHWVSFDLKDVFYSMAIDPKEREVVKVNLDGQLLQFCALPIPLSPFVF